MKEKNRDSLPEKALGPAKQKRQHLKRGVSEPCSFVKGLGIVFEERKKAEERVRRSRHLWYIVTGAAVLALLVFTGTLAVSISDGSRAAIVITALMTLSNFLLLYRLAQVYIPDFLMPSKPSAERSEFHYMEWRKAIQKPLESVGSLGLFATFLFVMFISDASRSDIDSIRSSIFALVAWAPVPGLVGSAGSDIVAWRLKQFPKKGVGLMMPPRKPLIRLSITILIAMVTGFAAGLSGHVTDAKVPELHCTPRRPASAPLAPNLLQYSCKGSGDLVPRGVASSATEQPWPRYECSAPPATRDASGTFPTTPPTYTCNKR